MSSCSGRWKAWGESAGFDYVRSCIWDKVDSAPQFTGDRPASAAEAITVKICKINRAFDQWIWLCGRCAAAKKRDGYTVEPREVVDAEFACDVCGRGQSSKAEARDVRSQGLAPSMTAVRDKAGQPSGGNAQNNARIGLPGELAISVASKPERKAGQ